VVIRNLFIDIETYSAADLGRIGPYRYAADPDFRLLLLAWSPDSEPVQVLDIEHGEEIPKRLMDALTDPQVTKWAHNAGFERVCLHQWLRMPMPSEQWRCTQAWARYLALPGSLADLSDLFKLGERAKLQDGKRLIDLFCVPNKKRSLDLFDDDWDLFKEYCARDVEAEIAVWERLRQYPMPESEWAVWEIDQKINDAGIPVNATLADQIRWLSDKHREELIKRAQTLTGLVNPNSPPQLQGWLKAEGLDIDNMQAKTVDQALRRTKPGVVQEVLAIRQQLARSAVKKCDVVIGAEIKNRIKGAFKYCGADTHRWAGRIFQPQNLPRPTISTKDIHTARGIILNGTDIDTLSMLYDDVSSVLTSLIRAIIEAPDGKVLVVADYSSIESVMAAWCAESEYLLNLFRHGRDPYKDFATKIFNVKYEEVTKHQRSLAKPCVLGGQYGLGAAGLKRYAEAFGIELSDDDAKKQINAYREAYSDIPVMWNNLERAVFQAVQKPHEPVIAGRFSFLCDGRFLILTLPSGRALYYYQPSLEAGRFKGKDNFHYLSRGKNKVGVHAGLLTENIVQSVSRDLLAIGVLHVAKDPGLEIVGHVHDEILALADEDDETALERMIAAMTQTPEWCPDAPIRAEGYIAKYYKKD